MSLFFSPPFASLLYILQEIFRASSTIVHRFRERRRSERFFKKPSDFRFAFNKRLNKRFDCVTLWRLNATCLVLRGNIRPTSANLGNILRSALLNLIGAIESIDSSDICYQAMFFFTFIVSHGWYYYSIEYSVIGVFVEQIDIPCWKLKRFFSYPFFFFYYLYF